MNIKSVAGRKPCNRNVVKSGSNTKIIAGKNFKDHFIRHKSLLEKVTGKNILNIKPMDKNF